MEEGGWGGGVEGLIHFSSGDANVLIWSLKFEGRQDYLRSKISRSQECSFGV